MESIKGNAFQAISAYATLMSPSKDETAVSGPHCLDCLPDGDWSPWQPKWMQVPLTTKSLVA